MKILLYFTIAVLVPSTKTLTTGAQRSDFIAELTKDYRLDLSTQHMKDLTKASPSFCMRNDSRRALNIHMGAYFICKALSVEIIIMSTPMKVTKTHLKTTNERLRFKYHSKGLNTSVCAIFMVHFSFALFKSVCKNCKILLSLCHPGVLSEDWWIYILFFYFFFLQLVFSVEWCWKNDLQVQMIIKSGINIKKNIYFEVD